MGTMTAHWSLKLLAIGILYVFYGHPYVYGGLWQRHQWLPLVAAAFVVPIGTYDSVKILVIRLVLRQDGFSLLTPTQRVQILFSEITHVDRRRGEVIVALRDGSAARIPWLVGNLDVLANEMRARISEQ
jgi:hypothetical protein